MLYSAYVYKDAACTMGKSFQTGGSAAAVTPSRYVLLSLATLITGYSVKAMERKIERGDWQEG